MAGTNDVAPDTTDSEQTDTSPSPKVNGHATNGSASKKNGHISQIKIPEDVPLDNYSPPSALNGSSGLRTAPARPMESKDQTKRLPAEKLLELTTSPAALPIHVQDDEELPPPKMAIGKAPESDQWQTVTKKSHYRKRSGSVNTPSMAYQEKLLRTPLTPVGPNLNSQDRPPLSNRTASTPNFRSKTTAKPTEKRSGSSNSEAKTLKPTPLSLDPKDARKDATRHRASEPPQASPIPTTIPLPPTSLSTYLSLELSSTDPSQLYIYRPSMRDFPYEPSRVKLERLMNFLLLPPQLEQTLWFGTLACLDAWLYTFTVLPLRFFKALYLLCSHWAQSLASEAKFVTSFIYQGLGRVWKRQKAGSQPANSQASEERETSNRQQKAKVPQTPKLTVFENGSATTGKSDSAFKKTSSLHRRWKSGPSNLLPRDKADILSGLLIITSCIGLMQFDASMMYHSIRGQAAIKLYVIYNALEVFDRLLAAIGQDVLECLFSKEALERGPDGRSKILRPLGLFMLALVYNITHALALFYQVITLNVAVNSFSNALLTLLMSNQFVEIKSTVFKRFEKENLFQMTCADVVERFQLWLMLLIIASRNIIETSSLFGDTAASDAGSASTQRAPSLLPSSFTLLPSWAGQVMGPFFLVLGIEMLVDWVKHAYITKFNNTKPNIYGRFLDVLAKDYYTHAFGEQGLTKRLGLPVLPLACLFIRASVQSYQMFLSTHLPLPLPSAATSLTEPSDPSQSPATVAEMLQLPHLLRRALGRHVPADAPTVAPWQPVALLPWLALPSADTCIAWISTGVLFALAFALLLALKLLLGMALLAYARRRYVGMKRREAASANAEGRRVGGWGTVEVDEEKRRWIYADDPDGLRKVWEREARGKGEKDKGFGGVERYSMVAKRIW